VPSVQEEASGTTYAVLNLCRAVARADIETYLHTIDFLPFLGDSAHVPLEDEPFQTLQYSSRSPLNRLCISPGMAKGLDKAAQEAEIIHSHGLWMMPNIYPGSSVQGTDCRLVCSPHGTMTEWTLRRSYWKKKVFWHLWQKKALQRAACFHATAVEEIQDVRRCGFSQPIALIPNGITIPDGSGRNRDQLERRQLLFISRIHPKKGIDILLKAWAQLQDRFPDWELLIVGPDHYGSIAKMQSLAKQVGAKRVSFPGPVYGEEKLQVYKNADLYVLPTHSENFGLTIAEALACGVPAITTKGAPWEGLVKNECGWWIDIGVEPLYRCLEEAMSASREELDVLGQRGREWMIRDYSWDVVGEMMAKTYHWVAGSGELPAWIELA